MIFRLLDGCTFDLIHHSRFKSTASIMFRVGRFACAPLRQVRWNSTATTPPMMATLRADLKTAMRAKDTARYGRILK
jgi:hypothetical protein